MLVEFNAVDGIGQFAQQGKFPGVQKRKLPVIFPFRVSFSRLVVIDRMGFVGQGVAELFADHEIFADFTVINQFFHGAFFKILPIEIGQGHGQYRYSQQYQKQADYFGG